MQRPSEPSAPLAAQTPRERLGNLAAAYGERLEQLVGEGKLTGSQAAALKQTQQSFLENLHRLAARDLQGGEPSADIGHGLAKVKQALQASFRAALDQPTTVEGGASAAERVAAVREKFGARLESLLSHEALGQEGRTSLARTAGEFDALLQRLGDALAQGSLKNPEHLSNVFAELLGNLRDSVRTTLAEERPVPGEPYSLTGAARNGDFDASSIERIA